MPRRILHYQGPIEKKPAPSSGHLSTWIAPALTPAIIIAVNAWLVWDAPEDMGSLFWVFFIVPIANACLATLLLFCWPIFDRVSGTSTFLHTWISVAGCIAAMFIDGAIIFRH